MRKIVARHVLADFVERRFRRAQLDRRAEPEHAQLVRKNADQVEIAARALRIDRAMGQLHFAGGIGQRAVFFVSGGGGQHHVGALRGFGEEHVLHDQQFEAGRAGPARRRAKVFSGFAPTT